VTHLVNRLDKVAGRYKELTGKPFTKISEEKLRLLSVIQELEKSVAELKAEKNPNQLQIQKLQAMLIEQQRNLNALKPIRS
jgi:uncharacterized small protein (DUF1192 family)